MGHICNVKSDWYYTFPFVQVITICTDASVNNMRVNNFNEYNYECL